ncbi:alkane hydroxylase MAH1-like [Salvia splendens]|uniref:alkane hydroxylase MAH1-like n=1 Tax=Salvia splendens TaxID=180675 RepID=UPI001C260698|nr:alkane hydroxylase MAH1-like [Salvia splendens]
MDSSKSLISKPPCPRSSNTPSSKALVPVLRHASEHNQVLDLQEVFTRYMIDATYLMATGSNTASVRVGFPHCPLMQAAMDNMADAVFWRNAWKLQSFLNIGTEKNMARACTDINQIVDNFLSTEHRQIGDDHFDVLNFYRTGGDNETPKKEFLAANIMTLFFAARDTSAAILTWFFYLINSSNPKSKKAILEEIDCFYPSTDIFPNAEDLGKMVYLHCALSESLRLCTLLHR